MTVREILIYEYVLLCILAPVVVFLYLRPLLSGFHKPGEQGFYLAAGICLAWGGEWFTRTWWLVWRTLDYPQWMVASPLLVIFVLLVALAAGFHIAAPVRGWPRHLRFMLAAAILAGWLFVAWITTR